MPMFALLLFNSSDSDSPRSESHQSEYSFKSAEQGENSNNMTIDVDMEESTASSQGSSDKAGFEKIMESIERAMSAQTIQHQIQIDRMQAEVTELKAMILRSVPIQENNAQSSVKPSTQTLPLSFSNVTDDERQNIKLKPIKWPEAYDHKDQNQWSTTHGVLLHIYKRDVEQRKSLEPSDFFMNLYSHAVTGTAKDMIRGKFQEMLTAGQTEDGLGILKAMDETYRDRNEEQKAASLFHACRQFRDEALSSFLPRFQQLLARSPSSTEDNKNKIYNLRNALNQTTRNYLVGRARPQTFSEFLEFLYAVGTEIDEVGLVKLRTYNLNQVRMFDDNTRGIAGGKLLGNSIASSFHRNPSAPPQQIPSNKGADGDTIMTGVNEIRAKFVSREEIERSLLSKIIHKHQFQALNLISPFRNGITEKLFEI